MNRDTCGTCGAPTALCSCAVLVALTEAHKELDAALAKAEPDEYEFIGRSVGTYGGRWVLTVEDKAAALPEGTAVYVRRRQA